MNGFTESGAGSLDLNVNSQSANSVQTGLGMRLSRPFQSGTTLILPQIYAFYQHEFANDSRGLDARLAQAGRTFAFQTDSPSRDFAVLGAGRGGGPAKKPDPPGQLQRRSRAERLYPHGGQRRAAV